jgi:hypothetical protein
MVRQLFHTFLFVTLLSGAGCSSAPVKQSKPSKTIALKVTDEPCWIKRPDCRAGAENTALYFIGQSEQPLASRGRPSRESIHSAQRDAEQQYARFLGVEIRSSLFLQDILKDEHYQSQFTHTLSSNVKHTVSDLIKADEFFAAYEQTAEGEPLWTVYVLIKIAKESVDKHRVAIAEEAKRLANAPPPPDEWTAEVFNIDDRADIHVNGTKVSQCEFSRSCTVKLSPHFKSGKNTVRLDYSNRIGFWTYGYKIHKNDELMYQGRCGRVWLYGCSWDMTQGVIHTFKFEVEQP